jgi:hypothetical protein
VLRVEIQESQPRDAGVFWRASRVKARRAGQSPYRALNAANYVRDAWSAWLLTDEQRMRRTINPRTGTTPWIMPDELGSPTLAEFPPEFTQLVKPEPLAKPKWVA